MKKILILGAGFGGLETATGLAEVLDEGYEITLVDRSDRFFIGFSKIDVLFRRATPEQVSFPYDELRAQGVRFIRDTVTEIDVRDRRVRTPGATFTYDYLVVALGAELAPEATPGFVESGGHEFYSMEGALALAPVLEEFTEGTLVLGVLGMPYKCPPAPYEVACQLDHLFRSRGLRDAVELKMVIPGPRPVKNPEVSEMLEAQVAEHGIDLVTGAPIESIDPEGRRVLTETGPVGYDLFVGVPVHRPPAPVRASELSEDGGFLRVSRQTLETRFPDVYAVGDVTQVPAGEAAVPKAGAFAQDAARTVVAEILGKEGLSEERVPFHARGACYFELGGGGVAMVDANYFEGEAPSVEVSGPSDEHREDKERFVASRANRWFR